MPPQVTLWHLAVSHYSEKVRWALGFKGIEHKRRPGLPGGHIPIALWLTKGKHATFPVLELDGQAIGDSTAIIAALEEHFPERPLYPADPEARRHALELEEYFDEELGPAIRRAAFHELRKEPARFDALAAQTVPGPAQRLAPVLGAYGRAYTALRFGVAKPGPAEEAKEKVLQALDRLEAELDGREYLVGDTFTVADLTAASLFYPLVLPPEGPIKTDILPKALQEFRAPLEDRPGYRWIQDTYRRHRR